LLSALDLAIECLGVANFVEQSAAYVVGPLVGAILAVGAAFILRGRGGGASGSRAAQHRGRPPRRRRPNTQLSRETPPSTPRESAGHVVNVTGSVELGNHEPRARAPDHSCAGERESPLLVHTRRTTHLSTLSALDEGGALDRSIDFLRVEDREPRSAVGRQ
jgi:hypothetical protein